jgi:predicted component of type VI protein secretion system
MNYKFTSNQGSLHGKNCDSDYLNKNPHKFEKIEKTLNENQRIIGFRALVPDSASHYHF